jgi:predicted dehydrogenase
VNIARLGIIGAGYWGRILARSLSNVPTATLSALATSRAENVADLVGSQCRLFADWKLMLASDLIDGVVIATPPSTHRVMIEAAFDRNLPVLVEKPMTHNLLDALAVRDRAVREQKTLHVDHTYLFSPAWKRLKENVSLIGKINRILARFGDTGPFRADISPIWDWAPHPIALCLDIGGKSTGVERVAITREIIAGRAIERVTFDLLFENGIVANIETGNDFLKPARLVLIEGDSGSLRYDDKVPDKLGYINGTVISSISVPSLLPVDIVLTRFASAIIANRPSFNDAEIGVSVIEVITALYN